MPSWPKLDYPTLSGLCLMFGAHAQPLTGMKNATCYVNSVIQAWVYIPAVANLAEKTWKQQCGCPDNNRCWLCCLGLRVASSHCAGKEKAEKAPMWVLKRLHLMMGGYGSRPGRGKTTPDDPDQVSLLKFLLERFSGTCCKLHCSLMFAVFIGESEAVEYVRPCRVSH